MNRILMDKLRLDLQAVDLCAIIAAAVESVEPTASAKKIRVRQMLDPRAGAVRGDPTRLHQIIWNLLSNAVKFTPEEGSIEVALSRVNSHVELSISDTGIGIAPEFLPVVFERFSQGDSSTTRRHGGLGLGLAIVKHLVELHGGSVQAKSNGEGKGTTFRVNLPFPAAMHRSFAEVHPYGISEAIHNWSTPDLTGRTILVIDDDQDAAELIAHLLSETGAGVLTANSGKEGLARLQEKDFHLIISDIGMPEMDGFEFIRTVRASKGANSDTPAMALAAFGRTEDRRAAMMSGFDVFLSKPIDSTELVASAHRMMARRSSEIF